MFTQNKVGGRNMKKFKTTLMTLIVSLCLVFGLAFAVACGDKTEGGGGSNNDQTQTDDNSVSYYKVTLSYDDTKGTVTKSDAAAADGYVKDETVTVTVTPKSGYVVDSVKAGNATLAPGADGKYSFSIVGDITVTVTFKDAPTYYTVTLSYDNTKGSVTKSDPTATDGYVKDEAVMLTVIPNRDYVVDTVKVGDTTIAPGTDGTYTFNVSGNVTVTVTFKDAPASEDALILDAEYYGTYHDIHKAEPSDDLVVGKRGVFWGDRELLLAHPYEEGDLGYVVTVDGVDYTLYVYDNGLIDLLDATSEGYTFLKDGVTLEFSVTVTVASDETWGTASLTPEKEAYSIGETVTLTATPASGYMIDDAMVNGEPISFDADGNYTFDVTRETTIFVYFKKDVPISDGFLGTWTNIADSSDTVTLAAKSLTWGDHEVSVDSIEEWEEFDYDVMESVVVGVNVTLTVDGNENVLVRLHNDANAFCIGWDVYSDEDPWTPTETYAYYFVKGDSTTFSAEDFTDGKFTQVGADPATTLTFAADGTVKIGDTAAKVYYTGEEYLVATDNAAYALNVVNDNYVTAKVLGADTPTTLHLLRDGLTVTPHAIYVGDWNGENGEKLTITADGNATLTGVEGVSVILLAADLENGASLLVTTADETFLASLFPSFMDGALTASLQTSSDFDTVSLAKTLDKLVLDSSWQSGYEYSGEDFPDFRKFVVNETGVTLVDQFNNARDDSYAYAVELDENTYYVYNLGYSNVTMTLNATDGTISIDNGWGNVFEYRKTTLTPVETFEVTIECGEGGSANLTDADGAEYTEYSPYKVAKPTEGTLTLTFYVATNSGYEVESVKVGDDELTADENGYYTYTTDGSTDITVVITFAEKQLEQLVIEDATLHGTTWSCSDAPYADTKLTIDAEGRVKLGDNDVLYVDDSYNGYLVMIDGVQWTLITTQVSENKLELMSTDMSGDVTPDYIFTKDGGSTAPTTYSVTITYGDGSDQTMGTVVADKDSYSAGETVTLTITPATGYTLGSVTVNGETESPTLNADGSYTLTFEIHSDTPVVVTFTASTAD